jgi:hypothetical protein
MNYEGSQRSVLKQCSPQYIHYIRSASVQLQYLLRNLTLLFAMSGEESSSLTSIEVLLDVDLVGVADPVGVGACSLGVKE